MSKKTFFLMVFVVLLALVAGTPTYGGVLFSSNWSTATGDSDNAVTDGGVWGNIHNEPVEGHTRLEVFPPDHPVLNGNNYLGAWMDGWMWCGVWEYDIWTTDANDIYFRFYQRTYPHNVEPNPIDFSDGHFVQPHQVYPPSHMKSTNCWFGIKDANETQWRAYISGMGQDDKWDLPYLFPRVCCLDTGKWYRIEGHIHYFRDLTEERGDVHQTTRVPSYVYLRIYDDNGTLVKDTNDWYLGEYTLQEWYDMDRYFWLEGVANSWFMGNNGPYSAEGSGPNWCADYAAIEIRDDTWPGPVGGDPQPPAQASNPSPADSANDVSVGANLIWSAGSGATSRDVYFGTTSPGSFQGNQTATTFEPGTMVNDMTYYWRIDEINTHGTTTGAVWNFTTEVVTLPPGQAANPNPTDSTTNISVGADLSWTPGSGTTSHDVYFGTSSPGTFQGNQTETTYDPGTMAFDTTYYWRIDEINTEGTTTGNVWNFTTQTAGGGTVLLVDFGGTEAENTFGLAGWDTVIKDNYTGYRPIGPGGTTIVSGNNEGYDYQGVTGSSRDFVVDEKIVVTWYNNSASQITFTPRMSFTDSDRPDASWYSMSQTIIDAYTTATSEFTVDAGSAGTYSLVNVNVYYSNNQILICDKIELVTGAAPPGQATSPGPADSAADVSIDTDLSWSAGSGATSHDVYFGTDSTPDSGEFQGNQTATTYEPGTMANSTTYYWRIDEINSEGTTTGNVWSFTTEAAPQPPGQASIPSPTNSAADVNVDADLSWTAGSGSTSSDVYFGTSSPGAFQGNQTANTYDPGTMANDTTYYWRIDEINAEGTTTGNVWNFTTEAAAGPDAFLQDSGTDGIVSMEAENYDVYTQQGSHDWISVTSPSGYSGSAAMNTTPNNGTNQNTDYAANSPRLDFQVDFVKTGTHYVWIRGSGASGTDDSIHAGLDGAEISTSDRISSFPSSYTWSKATMDGSDATFDVSSTGVHTVNVWMREDGFVFDKIVLTTNSGYTPTGDGPAESPRGGGPALPGQASNPGPSDSATDVAVNADLSWTAGSGATSHDVYFGTSSPGAFQGNQTAATFDTGTMSNDTTYYWRIDEINSAGTTTGDVWNFTTIVAAPGQATNPSPADSSNGVSTSADLSWSAGSGATSHDVYFGTSSPGAFQGNQTAATFDAGAMANNTTYYWRIDEVNAAATTTGTVWSFTTIVGAPTQASNPTPPNSATDVAVNTDLSWTAGSGATSHDVYFGTSSPGSYQGNQTATTFDTGAMANDTTYYWRIDEINAGGTTTGNVWSFTTIVAAPGQASSPSPADSATGVSVTADLSWTAGSGATSHDVYFGTSSPGSFQGNQTATTFDTGSMSNDTTYYWRIDEVNAGGTTTGTVWNFTTIVAAPSQATNPSPADSATDVAVDADLNWTAGSGTTSHDVYFGTSSPGAFQGNQTPATFDTGTMDNDTTYYWRIDEVNPGGTTTGVVWSFTTITSGQPVTKEFGDAENTDYPDTIEDTRCRAGFDENYSNTTKLTTYTWPADTVANTIIIKWDLSAIPTDVAVTEATLYLYQKSSGGDTYYDVPVHKIVNVNPVISACTWNTYDGTNSWTGGADGGQSDTAAAEDTPTVNSTNNEYKTWTVNNMVQDWVTTPSNNFGMLVNSDDVASIDSWRYFASTEDGNTPHRPKLIVTYIAGVPGQATNPDPNDTATDVTVDAVLSWTAGSAATSHDVYFGTTSPGAFQGNQTQTTFDPGTLSYDITYYWRIDEVNAAGTTTGNVWTFTTEAAPQPPGQATNPNPADTATNVDVDADLSWTAGTGSTSSDVYFGTTSPGAFQGNQTSTTFDPETMTNDTTYYWRIDEINGDGTTTGNVWTFTTIVAAPSQATNPSPADSATDVDIDADLNWTAGSGSTSSDVYFGTTSPGTFQGNQTATTFDPGTIANDTTYYWRIDEVNAGGITTGVVWSFTTIVAAPSQATNPNPADSATDVDIDADLSWNAGSGSTSSDVYFGTTSPGTFQGNQTATTFDPGTMANDTTYYWRIDEINTAGTTTGNVWSFTTEAAAGPVTKEFGDAVNTDYPGTIEDTWTNQGGGGSTNYSTADQLNTFTWPADTVANTIIIKWDLSAIPTSATVTEATLYLYQTGSGGDSSYDVPVHKIVNVNPVISACTWNTYDGTNSWTGGADGGQSDTAADEDTPSLNSTNNEYKTWTVTNMVADWVSTPSSNYGMLVNSDDVASSDSWRYFASTEDGNNPYRPKLIVSYTTGAPPGQASNPSPADSATDVSIDADLSWTAGTGSTSSDVYFGTTSPGTFQGNQTATTFDPGTMANDTTYYWRIDEINAAGTTTGAVWTFTTVPAPSDVEIIGSWISGTSHTAESGTDRLLVFTTHAEDNNADMNITSVTYGGQTMTKVIEENEGSGYRAYAGLFILDEDGINAASGSSFIVTWAETPNRTPAFTSVFMQNVNQTSPVGASDSNGGTTSTVSTSALSTSDGDMVVLAATCGNTGTYSVNNGFTEAIELTMTSADGVAGYKAATGANETPSVTHSNINRQVIAALVVQAQ